MIGLKTANLVFFANCVARISVWCAVLQSRDTLTAINSHLRLAPKHLCTDFPQSILQYVFELIWLLWQSRFLANFIHFNCLIKPIKSKHFWIQMVCTVRASFPHSQHASLRNFDLSLSQKICLVCTMWETNAFSVTLLISLINAKSHFTIN